MHTLFTACWHLKGRTIRVVSSFLGGGIVCGFIVKCDSRYLFFKDCIIIPGCWTFLKTLDKYSNSVWMEFPSTCGWLLSGRASKCKINAKPKSKPWLLGKLQTHGAYYILLIVVRSSYNGINAV